MYFVEVLKRQTIIMVASSYAYRIEIDHLVEKSKIPHECLIGVGVIYFYLSTQMFINLLRYNKDKQKS